MKVLVTGGAGFIGSNICAALLREGAYGNVIPIFAFRALCGEPITIFGDGLQTRDFVHVNDVVQANLNAAKNYGTSGAYNIASGTQMQILELAHAVNSYVDAPVEIQHAPERAGDVAHSLADISAARAAFGFNPTVAMESGLAQYMAWAKDEVRRQDL